METYVWYFDNVDEVMGAIEKVKDTFPCFVTVETLELNWAEVTIEARTEDVEAIDRIFTCYA